MRHPVVLSASRIKLFQTCSYAYYCRYVLKLPDSANDGANRGNIVHLVLELLLNKRHSKHFACINEAKSIFASPAIHRLVLKHAKIKKVDNEENITLINEMILVGLKQNFFCDSKGEAPTFISPEEAFNLDTDQYSITGFIDKIAIFNNKNVDIWDYKTNKSKFTAKDLDGNLQNLMYSLYSYRKHGVIPQVRFLFLRFPKDPVLPAERCSEEELLGFENYLGYLTDHLTNFSIAKATANYASDSQETKWLCGFARRKGQLTKNGKVMFSCQYKFPFSYYALISKKDGTTIKTSEKIADLKVTDDTKIIFRKYHGCPAHGYKITKKIEDAPNF